MTVQSNYKMPGAILNHIDRISAELAMLRQAVQALIARRPQEAEDLLPHLETSSSTEPRRSLLEIIAEAPGQQIFDTAESVDKYIAEERAAWDD